MITIAMSSRISEGTDARDLLVGTSPFLPMN